MLNAVKRTARKALTGGITPLLSYLMGRSWGRDALYRAFDKNSLVACTTDEGIRYVVHASDNVIGRTVFRSRKSYDSQHLARSMGLLGKKRSILLDAGANIGTIGIFAVSQGFVKKCLAFEPDPTNFRLLTANVQLNGLADRFELHNVALSAAKTEPLQFELSPDNFGDHRVRTSDDQGLHGEHSRDVIRVETDALDNLCAELDLGDCVLFMDTQGFEGEVLSGAGRLIDARVPIVTEFWPYGLARSGGTEKFYAALASAGYENLYDLRHPDRRIAFSTDEMRKIAAELGDDGRFTDLLIF